MTSKARAGTLGFAASLACIAACPAHAEAPPPAEAPPRAETAPRSETLADAISSAYESNPDLLAQRAQLRTINERYIQARAALGVNIDASVSLQAQHALVDGQVQRGTTYNAQTTTETLTVTQPLYTGGRGSASIDAARANIFVAYQNLRAQENRILNEVVGSYADVQRDQQLVEIGQENVALLEGQVRETGAKLAVRESTVTDRDQGYARLAEARAELELAKARLEISRANYQAIVGHEPGDLAEPPVLPALGATLDEAQAAAKVGSPQLLSAEFQERSSRAGIRLARGAGLPSATLRGDVNQGPLVGYDERLRNNYQAVRLIVSVPLFASGATASRIREAQARNEVDANLIDSAERQVTQSVTRSWSQLSAETAALALYDQQVNAQGGVYKGTKIQERFALRSTLDILNAAQELNRARVNRAAAEHDAYLAKAQLLATAGKLEPGVFGIQPEEDLSPDIRQLNRHDRVPWIPLIRALDAVGQPSDTP